MEWQQNEMGGVGNGATEFPETVVLGDGQKDINEFAPQSGWKSRGAGFAILKVELMKEKRPFYSAVVICLFVE